MEVSKTIFSTLSYRERKYIHLSNTTIFRTLCLFQGGGGESMYTETYYHMLYNNYWCIQFLCAGFSGVSDDSSQFHHISRHS